MTEKIGANSIIPPLRLVFLMWLFFSIETFLGFDFGFLGINPRTYSGLIGIITAPMIHGNFGHLVSNTVPVLFLGVTLYFFYPSIASRIFIQCYFFTNFFVWLLARPSYHIGASGLVYALAFFLIFFGFFRRDFKTLIISFGILIVYGGLIYSVFNFNETVSWESHIFGAISGIMSAYTTSNIHRYK